MAKNTVASNAAVGATTVTCKGGLGGVGMVAGTGLLVVAGGAGVVPTNGDINTPGQPGQNGVRLSGILGGAGGGGGCPLGAGGAPRTTNGAGNVGTGFGGGGGGGASVTASQTGGVGTAGCWVVDEYA